MIGACVFSRNPCKPLIAFSFPDRRCTPPSHDRCTVAAPTGCHPCFHCRRGKTFLRPTCCGTQSIPANSGLHFWQWHTWSGKMDISSFSRGSFFCKVRKILLNPAGDKRVVEMKFCVIRIGAIVYIRVLLDNAARQTIRT